RHPNIDCANIGFGVTRHGGNIYLTHLFTALKSRSRHNNRSKIRLPSKNDSGKICRYEGPIAIVLPFRYRLRCGSRARRRARAVSRKPPDKSYFAPGKAAKAAFAGQSWFHSTLDVAASQIWAIMSVHCFRLLKRLELEHLRHSGQENGYLI